MRNTICFECGSKNDYELRKTKRQYEGEGYCFTMDVEVPFCKKCGAPIVIEEIERDIAERANEKIRESRGIIKKDEIIAILTQYNVSQKLLSRLLGWGEITLTRYISGGYTPNVSNSEKLKSLKDPYVFQKLVNDNLEAEKVDAKNATSLKKLQVNIKRGLEDVENKSGKIYQIVNWFLSQTTEENPITHLALQKILYFSQSWNMAWNHKWLFEDECQAWVHGAVYRNIYDEFKKFKYMPLPKVNTDVRLAEEEIEVLEFVKKYYFDVYTAKSLETICHLEAPYKLARNGYEKGENCEEIIRKEDIQEYYVGIAKRYEISKENPNRVKDYLSDLLKYLS
ncbi:MAG: DUF4065 domain-containing protein [Tyzzerella sp.]|nr:DUF4065 domain-containing protein [Tyzzerella sp.]